MLLYLLCIASLLILPFKYFLFLFLECLLASHVTMFRLCHFLWHGSCNHASNKGLCYLCHCHGYSIIQSVFSACLEGLWEITRSLSQKTCLQARIEVKMSIIDMSAILLNAVSGQNNVLNYWWINYKFYQHFFKLLDIVDIAIFICKVNSSVSRSKVVEEDVW
jgi:hypothetical protein